MQNIAMHTLHTLNRRFMRYSMLFAAALLVVALAAFLCLCAPLRAFAQSANYTMPEVSIRAQVETDGSMQVVEQRTFAFTGANSMLKWQFDALPKGSSRVINSVRVAQAQDDGSLQGSWQDLPSEAFSAAWRDGATPAANEYSLDTAQNALYVFYAVDSGTYVVEIDYTLTEFVQVYDDAALISWGYMSSAWPAVTEKLNMRISLPVPYETKVTPDQTVKAWGHGPAGGTVSTHSDGSVVYLCNHHNPGQYATTSVLFPTDWLSNLSLQAIRLHAGARIGDALAQEESTWADSSAWYAAIGLRADLVYAIICCCLVLLALLLYVAFGRKFKPETGSRAQQLALQAAFDLPPVAIARLFRWNQWSNSDLAEYGPADVAPNTAAANMWQESVNAEVANAGLFDQRSLKAEKFLFAAAAAWVLVSVLMWRITGGHIVPLVAGLITAIALVVVGNYLPRRTQLGENIVAALTAPEGGTSALPEEDA